MSSQQPNIIFIMSDDHASHAISAYGSRINQTPNIDRLATGGLRLENCFCTNSICTPSRAAILTGTYNHVNGVTTLETPLDNRITTYPQLLQSAGYQTAIFGKWHLGGGPRHSPTGFDDWAVLPGQGDYHDPSFYFKGEDTMRRIEGYATDIITDMGIDWMKQRDTSRPFCLMCHHKAPHRPWEPAARHASLYADEDIPEPDTLFDEYENRSHAAQIAKMRVGEDMNETDLKRPVPPDLKGHDLRRWAYQHYIKDYLRVIAAIDENVGRILDYLDESGLAENTIVVYTSDQGFFLGDHGWYDKRFMYEESLRMPFLVRFPREIAPGSVSEDIVSNVDFAPTFLDYAGVEIPASFQGRSARSVWRGETPPDWPKALYYRYWMHGADHNVAAHYGIRTLDHKLIYYYYDGMGLPGTLAPRIMGSEHVAAVCEGDPEWELFDLKRDPCELNNVYHDPAYAEVAAELRQQLRELQLAVGDQPHPSETP